MKNTIHLRVLAPHSSFFGHCLVVHVTLCSSVTLPLTQRTHCPCFTFHHHYFVFIQVFGAQFIASQHSHPHLTVFYYSFFCCCLAPLLLTHYQSQSAVTV